MPPTNIAAAFPVDEHKPYHQKEVSYKNIKKPSLRTRRKLEKQHNITITYEFISVRKTNHRAQHPSEVIQSEAPRCDNLLER